VLLGALWGAVYPLNTVVLRELPVAAVVVWRTGLSAAVLAPFAWRSGVLGAVRAQPLAVLGAALLQATIPLVLLTAGQQHVGAGLAGIILASQAVWAAVMTSALDRAVQRNVVVGVLVGLAGVALLFVRNLNLGGTSGLGGAALVGAAMSYAAGTVYIERVIPKVPPLATATTAMVVSAVALGPFAIRAAPPVPDLETFGWLVLLSHAGSGGALVLFYWLIRRVGAVRASLAGYLAPGFAVGYGSAFLTERVSLVTVIGFGSVLTGTYLVGRGEP
jgi:drug/metabolite transporter (DMT)-like permease